MSFAPPSSAEKSPERLLFRAGSAIPLSILLVIWLFSETSCLAEQWTPGMDKNLARKKVFDTMNHEIPGLKFSKSFPLNFPISVYPKNVVRTSFSSATQGPPTAAATITTKDSPDAVQQWYQSQCKNGNWNVKVPTDKLLTLIGKQNFYLINATKGKENLNIYCLPDKSTNGTTVSITWAKRP